MEGALGYLRDRQRDQVVAPVAARRRAAGMTPACAGLGAVIWLADRRRHRARCGRLVTALDHPPGSAGRTDLTARRRRRGRPRELDAAEADLDALADQVDALGTRRAAPWPRSTAPTRAGDARHRRGRPARGRHRRADRRPARGAGRRPVCRHAGGRAARLATRSSARHAGLVAALDATDGLDADWKRLTTGAVAADAG